MSDPNARAIPPPETISAASTSAGSALLSRCDAATRSRDERDAPGQAESARYRSEFTRRSRSKPRVADPCPVADRVSGRFRVTVTLVDDVDAAFGPIDTPFANHGVAR